MGSRQPALSIANMAATPSASDPDEEATTPWIQYDWSKPVLIDKVDLYWAADRPRPIGPAGSESIARMVAPASYRILYWDGHDYVPVSKPQGLETTADRFNATTFDAVKTDKLRVEIVPKERHWAGVLEWRVYSSGPAPVTSSGGRCRHRPFGCNWRQNIPLRQGDMAPGPAAATQRDGPRNPAPEPLSL